jgi:hypothetical protein
VARLESAAGAAAAVVAGEVSVVDVCWSVRDRRVDAAGLVDGELVAADVRGYGSGVARVEERVTTDLRDLGGVYDVGGRLVGLVTSIDGSLLTLSIEGGVGGGLPPAA